MTDVLFTSFGFLAMPARAGMLARNMQVRLNDIFNVRDFGAKGNGVDDDWAAINAAIDAAYTRNASAGRYMGGGMLFFPPGVYLLGQKLKLDRDTRLPAGGAGFAIVGSGRDATILRGTWGTGEQYESVNNGALVECGGWPSNSSQILWLVDLAIENLSTDNTSHAFHSMAGNIHVENCRFKGFSGMYTGYCSFGTHICNNIAECTVPITAANAASRSPLFLHSKFSSFGGVSAVSGSVGFWIAGGLAYNNQATGFDVGFGGCGYGLQMYGNRADRCGLGLWWAPLGGNPTGAGNVGGPTGPGNDVGPFSYYPTNGVFAGNVFYRCTWGMHGGVVDGIVGGNLIDGSTGPYTHVDISSMKYNASSHVVTVTTAAPTNVSVGDVLQLAITTSGGSNPWTSDPNGFITVLTVSTSVPYGFTYAGPPSTTPSPFSSGTWNYPLEYGITQPGVVRNFFVANALNAVVSKASFDIIHPEVIQNTVAGGYNFAGAMLGSYGWQMSHSSQPELGKQRAAGWEFVQCGTPSKYPFGASYTLPFAYLPPIQLFDPPYPPPIQFRLCGPVEGTECLITDGQKSGGGTAAFGDVVAGGGGGRYKVRYNNGTWIRVA
jgi:hypothetical protein